MGHEDEHEQRRHRTQCEGDGDAGEHGGECRAAIHEPEGERAHAGALRVMPDRICSAMRTVSRVIPTDIVE